MVPLMIPLLAVCFVPPKKHPQYPTIAREIVSRCSKDQSVRNELTENKDSKLFPAIIRRMQSVDRDNTAYLHQVIDQIGWPSREKVGSEASHDAFLMVQHADLDKPFQKRCLSLLLPYMDRGEVQRPDAALLIDRVRIGEGKPQVYGSQWMIQNGSFVMQGNLQDPVHVDDRRKAMNLQPLADYKKVLESVYANILAGSKNDKKR